MPGTKWVIELVVFLTVVVFLSDVAEKPVRRFIKKIAERRYRHAVARGLSDDEVWEEIRRSAGCNEAHREGRN